jgi:tRNA A37 threonylcarbamoyladenosine biosynthesis protein TsaE
LPNHSASEPIQRIDLNLYTADVIWLKTTIGNGWTTFVRELVRTHIKSHPRAKPTTIGDLIDEDPM